MGVVTLNAFGKLQRVLEPLVSLIPALGVQPCFWSVTTEVEQRLFKGEKLGDLSWFQMHYRGAGCYMPSNQQVHKAQIIFFSLLCVTLHALFYMGIRVFVARGKHVHHLCGTVPLP